MDQILQATKDLQLPMYATCHNEFVEITSRSVISVVNSDDFKYIANRTGPLAEKAIKEAKEWTPCTQEEFLSARLDVLIGIL